MNLAPMAIVVRMLRTNRTRGSANVLNLTRTGVDVSKEEETAPRSEAETGTAVCL